MDWITCYTVNVRLILLDFELLRGRSSLRTAVVVPFNLRGAASYRVTY